jgi:proteasome lid subunit RPN8/RPN11
MAIEIDLYRSVDYVRSHRIPVAPLLREIFEPLLGQSLSGVRFKLVFLPVAGTSVLDGNPVMVNLRGGHDYVQVLITKDGDIVYQHPHSVMEIFARPLQAALARREPDERHWGFGIVGIGGSQAALVRPRPHVAMSMNLPTGEAKKRPLFHVEELAAPEPPAASLTDLGVSEAAGQSADAPVSVVLTASAHESLSRTMSLSPDVEEGGFLVGRVFGNAGRPGRYLVEVTEVIEAERTGASLLHFTFTGDSFTRIGELISTRQTDEELVGWYHTHLFPASDELGLSSIDVDLHDGTFRRPWQLAGLVNLTRHERVVRFYAGDQGTMAKMPVWVSAA